MLQKIKTYALLHKIQSGVALFFLAGASYWTYGKLTGTNSETLYTTAVAQKGTIVSSISGSGQVSASDQVDIKPKVSGDIAYVSLTNGQSVYRGSLIAQLDTKDAEKVVRDAETSLETAKLTLEKILKPADTLSLIQSENSLTNAKQAKTRAEDNLAVAYDDAFTSVSNAFIDLAPVITGIQDILYKNTNNAGQDNISYYTDLVKNYDTAVYIYRDSAAAGYQTARSAYDKTFLQYKTVNRDADKATIEKLLTDTSMMARAMTESVKNTSNFLSFVKDKLTERNNSVPTQLTSNQTSIDSYTSKTNSSLSNLTGNVSSLKNAKDTLVNSESTITERTESLAKLKAGSDELDIRSARISVQQKEDALQDAKDNLEKYYIRSPFDGTVTKISVKKGDSVGSGTAIATVVTKQKLAEISLNEVDVSKVKLGNKATVTFDAIEGLTITGQVVELDTIGTVSQGVVTYNIKISFDTQDDRVKAGMSMSVAIITGVKPDVIVVPNSAIKSRGELYYVEISDNRLPKGSSGQGTPSDTPPRQVTIEIGIANDTETEIISGIKEGDNVIIRTVAPSATPVSTQAPSIFGAAGGGNRNAGGNAVRIPR
ncbi:MAG: efflux RND transporter periplasmic adaptor subunit [bacterium]|nr:efflux RND transporter periplasmic adaptor subunit [bacterium]